MSKTFRVAALVVTAVIALSGCSSSGSDANSADSTSNGSASGVAATAAAVATGTAGTSTVPTASQAQYASLVAKEKVGLDKTLTELLGPHCDWTTPGAVDVRPGYITCAAGSLTVGLQAKTLALELSGAQTPTSKTYIGAPPAQIKSLVEDTLAAAKSLGTASTKTQNCTSSTGTACTRKLFTFSSAMTQMQSQLAAWTPYGV